MRQSKLLVSICVNLAYVLTVKLVETICGSIWDLEMTVCVCVFDSWAHHATLQRSLSVMQITSWVVTDTFVHARHHSILPFSRYMLWPLCITQVVFQQLSVYFLCVCQRLIAEGILCSGRHDILKVYEHDILQTARGTFTKFTVLVQLWTKMNWLDFEVKRSKVKVMRRPNMIKNYLLNFAAKAY